MKTLLALALAVLSGTAVPAQTLDDVTRQERELDEVWAKTPLGIRRAVFVTERAPLYGAFSERPSNVFKRGEVLLTYIEPIGYSWTPDGNGFSFGVTLDFVVKQPDGKVLGGQEKFLNFAQKSRNKVRELMVNIDLNLSGAPAGDYVLEYRMHDVGNGRTASVEQTFRIVE